MANILTIFDFDETLITSETEIIIQHADGNITYMNSEDYANYVSKPGDKFDYSNFDKYPKDARKIKLTFTELESALSRGDHVMILTARSNRAPVEEFMKNHGYDVEVVTVGSSNPQAKARVVMDRVVKADYDLVQVFEDNATNIRAIKKVVTDAGVRFRSTKISASHRTQLLERLLRKARA